MIVALLVAAVALAFASGCGGSSTPRQMPAPAAPAAAAAALTPAARAPSPVAADVRAPTAAATATAPPQTITIAAVGDLMFARDVTDLMFAHGTDYPFARVLPLFAGADLIVGNLEGTFTERGTALEKFYTFRTPPTLAATLAAAGFDAVTLGNNHAYDFGEDGLADTLAAVRGAGVAAFGAGLDEATARAPVIAEAHGLRVALLGYDDIGEVRLADGANPGVARADEALIASDVSAAAGAADFVVVFVHWGVEYSHAPTDRQRALARAAIDAGASAVIGGHPHVLQPWARIDDAVVLFSLGNFVFDLDPDDWATLGPAPFESAVALITLSRERPPDVEWRPVLIDPIENRPRPATADEAPAIRALLGDGTNGGR